MDGVWYEVPKRGAVARARVASIADIRTIERTPYEELLPSWSILGMLQHHAALSPNKTGLLVADPADPTCATRRMTYAELESAVRTTAHQLREVAPEPTVVSILTPLLAESFIAFWAGATVGVANPINPFLRIEHVAGIMNSAGTTVLVCGSAIHGPGVWNDVDSLRTMVPTLREVWYVDRASADGMYRREVIRVDREATAIARHADAVQTAALFHTGGTTAAPKLVRLTEQGMLLNAWCCGTWFGNHRDDVVAVGMPYFHAAGAVCLSLSTITFGQTMVIVSPDGYRDARVVAEFWNMVQAHGITAAGSAPTSAAAIVTRCSGRAPPDFHFWAGGAAVPVQLAREFADKFGIPLLEGWGMTEVQGGLIVNPCTVEPRLGSIGLLFPYHRARCVPLGSPSADIEIAPGTVGTLAISGPCVTPGYADAQHSAQLFLQSSEAGERWLNTGDLCAVDADGYFWHRGRSKDLIIRGAHNIDPLAIEDALLDHPGVLYAAAIGEPDRDKGELPVAYVQLRPGSSVCEAELVEHCRARIPERAAVPRTVRVIAAMPLTAVGKIFKPELRLDAVRRCVLETAASMQAASDIGITIRETGGSIVVVLSAAGHAGAAAAAELRRELERYTFRVDVEGGDGN